MKRKHIADRSAKRGKIDFDLGFRLEDFYGAKATFSEYTPEQLASMFRTTFENSVDLHLQSGAIRPEGVAAVEHARRVLAANFESLGGITDGFRNRGYEDVADLIWTSVLGLMNSCHLIGGLTQSHSTWVSERLRSHIDAESAARARSSLPPSIDTAVRAACEILGEAPKSSEAFARRLEPYVTGATWEAIRKSIKRQGLHKLKYDPPAQDIALAWTDEVAYFPANPN